ncbi:interleukin 34-like motif protein [Ranid herpesvirus 3]|uniref:Interleukin 34-like motif protein n=1 Tax=Ranid herpesvirus 3 TaxID=1987509 RepID=A0A1X9T5K2_9VIRU|nr:interleukin 34-like motif protein [Ranid herpesvirus 3]ARR28982.1 interleukin 34-like motif protein [Ranid herpesvirus 3]
MARLHRGHLAVRQWSVFDGVSLFSTRYHNSAAFMSHLEWLDGEAKRWNYMMRLPMCVRTAKSYDPVNEVKPEWMTEEPGRWHRVVGDFRVCYYYLLFLVSQENALSILAAYNVRAAIIGLHIIMCEFIGQRTPCYDTWIESVDVKCYNAPLPVHKFPMSSFLELFPVLHPSDNYLKVIEEADAALVVWKQNISFSSTWRNESGGIVIAPDLVLYSSAVGRLIQNFMNAYKNLIFVFYCMMDADAAGQQWCWLQPRRTIQDVTTFAYYFNDFVVDWVAHKERLRVLEWTTDV